MDQPHADRDHEYARCGDLTAAKGGVCSAVVDVDRQLVPSLRELDHLVPVNREGRARYYRASRSWACVGDSIVEPGVRRRSGTFTWEAPTWSS